MKFYKLAAAVAVLVSSTANAAMIDVYDNRLDFRAATGTTAVTEDFNSVTVGTSFIGMPLDLGGFTLERTEGLFPGIPTGEIQAGTGNFSVNGTNFASVGISPSVGELVLNFAVPIFSFGLDLNSFNDEVSAGDTTTLRTSIWLDGVIGVPMLTAAPDSITRFLGFTSDTSFSSISFVADLLPSPGDSFGIDNIEYSTVSAVPVPAAAWLFGSAILGMFGFSRRKTRV